MKCFIYWTADLKSSKLWSSQLWTQFKQLRIEASIRNCLNCVRNFDGHSLLEKESCWNRLTGTPGTNELKRKGHIEEGEHPFNWSLVAFVGVRPSAVCSSSVYLATVFFGSFTLCDCCVTIQKDGCEESSFPGLFRRKPPYIWSFVVLSLWLLERRAWYS